MDQQPLYLLFTADVELISRNDVQYVILGEAEEVISLGHFLEVALDELVGGLHQVSTHVLVRKGPHRQAVGDMQPSKTKPVTCCGLQCADVIVIIKLTMGFRLSLSLSHTHTQHDIYFTPGIVKDRAGQYNCHWQWHAGLYIHWVPIGQIS